MNRSREWGSGRVAGGGGLIRVLLVDDQALLRAGLRMLIEHEDDIELVGEAVDAEQAVAAARALQPDVVLLDVNMPGLDGVEATRQIAADEQLSDVGILILTSYETEEHIFEALKAGASGFLLKDTDPAELLRAIRVLADGDAMLAPSVTRALISRFASHPCKGRISSEQVRWLTERERDVTALVAAGLSNDEIAERLVISPSTAKTHGSRAMRKVRAHDRAALVVLAYESGLVVPGRFAAEGPRLRVVGGRRLNHSGATAPPSSHFPSSARGRERCGGERTVSSERPYTAFRRARAPRARSVISQRAESSGRPRASAICLPLPRSSSAAISDADRTITRSSPRGASALLGWA